MNNWVRIDGCKFLFYFSLYAFVCFNFISKSPPSSKVFPFLFLLHKVLLIKRFPFIALTILPPPHLWTNLFHNICIMYLITKSCSFLLRIFHISTNTWILLITFLIPFKKKNNKMILYFLHAQVSYEKSFSHPRKYTVNHHVFLLSVK